MIKAIRPRILDGVGLSIVPAEPPSVSVRARPASLAMDEDRVGPSPQTPVVVERAARLVELASHLEMLWRFACRIGASTATAEDVAQEAFVIAASRLDSILLGKERSYLVSVVMSLVRRDRQRAARHEPFEDAVDARPNGADVRLDDERARNLLNRALDHLDDELRAVFVLHEIEEETMAEIACLLDIPPGTVASRLRRAREEWKKATVRLKREWEVSLPAREPAAQPKENHDDYRAETMPGCAGMVVGRPRRGPKRASLWRSSARVRALRRARHATRARKLRRRT